MKNPYLHSGAIKFIGKRMTPFVAQLISNAVFNFLKISGHYGIQMYDHGTEFTLYPDNMDAVSNEILVINVVNAFRAFQNLAEERDPDEFLD